MGHVSLVMPELPDERSKEIRAFISAIEDGFKALETEWTTIWERFDTDMADWSNDTRELIRGLFGAIPILKPSPLEVLKGYLQISKLADIVITLTKSLGQLPVRVAVKVLILRFPLPKEFHHRAVPLDDGLRIGITVMTSAFLDMIASPFLPLEMMIKRFSGRVRLTKFIRTIPDFDPLEAADIFRSKILAVVIAFVSVLFTFAMLVGLLLALIVVAERLNDPVYRAQLLPFALPQDSKRIYTTRKNQRHRINQMKGPDQ